MSTTTLLSELQSRSAKALERIKQEAEERAKNEDEQRQAGDLEKVKRIIEGLPVELLAASYIGNNYKVLGDIDRFHSVAIEKLKHYLDGEQIRWEEKTEIDPGTDSSWRDLWALW